MVAGCLYVESEVYKWYLYDYLDNLRSTSGIWMTIGKSEVYLWYLDDYR